MIMGRGRVCVCVIAAAEQAKRKNAATTFCTLISRYCYYDIKRFLGCTCLFVRARALYAAAKRARARVHVQAIDDIFIARRARTHANRSPLFCVSKQSAQLAARDLLKHPPHTMRRRPASAAVLVHARTCDD